MQCLNYEPHVFLPWTCPWHVNCVLNRLFGMNCVFTTLKRHRTCVLTNSEGDSSLPQRNVLYLVSMDSSIWYVEIMMLMLMIYVSVRSWQDQWWEPSCVNQSKTNHTLPTLAPANGVMQVVTESTMTKMKSENRAKDFSKVFLLSSGVKIQKSAFCDRIVVCQRN